MSNSDIGKKLKQHPQLSVNDSKEQLLAEIDRLRKIVDTLSAREEEVNIHADQMETEIANLHRLIDEAEST